MVLHLLGSRRGGGGGAGISLEDTAFCTDPHPTLENWITTVENWAYRNEGQFYGDPNRLWSNFMVVKKIDESAMWMWGSVTALRPPTWTFRMNVSIPAGDVFFIVPEAHRFSEEKQLWLRYNSDTSLPIRIRANGEVYSPWDLLSWVDEAGYYHALGQTIKAWPLSEVGDPTL